MMSGMGGRVDTTPSDRTGGSGSARPSLRADTPRRRVGGARTIDARAGKGAAAGGATTTDGADGAGVVAGAGAAGPARRVPDLQ